MKKLFLTFTVLFFTLFFSGSSEARVEAKIGKYVVFDITKSGWSEWIGVEGQASFRVFERRYFDGGPLCYHMIWVEVNNRSDFTVSDFGLTFRIYDYKYSKWLGDEVYVYMQSPSTKCKGKIEVAPHSRKQFCFGSSTKYNFNHLRLQSEHPYLECRAVKLNYYKVR